jgi:hypothetical protein
MPTLCTGWYVFRNMKRHQTTQAANTRRFYTVGMDDGKQIIIEALKKHAREAMTKAKEFRAVAAAKCTKEECKLYLQQAAEEEAKARGYLKHAEILGEVEP